MIAIRADLDNQQKLKEFTAVVRDKERQLVAFTLNLMQNLGMKPSNEDLEDLISDAYLVAAEKLISHKDLVVNNAYAWFRKFILYEALGQFKKYKKLKLQLQIEVDLLEDLRQGNNKNYEQLKQATAHLAARDRKIILLSAEGYTSGAIARKMNMSAANIRKIKSRILKEFKNKKDGRS